MGFFRAIEPDKSSPLAPSYVTANVWQGVFPEFFCGVPEVLLRAIYDAVQCGYVFPFFRLLEH